MFSSAEAFNQPIGNWNVSAVNEMNAQRAKFHLRKVTGPREAKYRALMKYQRAKGIVDTLRWTIGVRGQKSPLKEGLGD